MDITKPIALEEALKNQIEDYHRRFKENALTKPSHCPGCRQRSRLRWHGSYHRRLITMAKTYEALPVKRILCVLCHQAFALLPGFVEKFYRYAKAAIFFALKLLKTSSYKTVADIFTASAGRPCAPLTLYLWRRKFA